MNIDNIIARAEVLTLLYCILELHKTLKLHDLPHAKIANAVMHQVMVLQSTGIQCMKTMHHSKHEAVTFKVKFMMLQL